jgi:hypothetical protein
VLSVSDAVADSKESLPRRELDKLLHKIAEKSKELERNGAKLDAQMKEFDAQIKQSEQGFSYVGSRNFDIGAPSKTFAEAVLQEAERIRQDVARTWFEQDLDEGKEFTLIHVEFSADVDEGLTLLCGPNRAIGGHHRIWLTTTAERATGSSLRHEIAHVVLNARFPAGMPVWANEGIASLYDDEGRRADRERRLRQFASSGDWPSVERIINKKSIRPTDVTSYAVAVSLTEFLADKADRPRFIKFVERGQHVGWERAVEEYYRFGSLSDLQKRWQTWVSSRQKKPIPAGETATTGRRSRTPK